MFGMATHLVCLQSLTYNGVFDGTGASKASFFPEGQAWMCDYADLRKGHNALILAQTEDESA